MQKAISKNTTLSLFLLIMLCLSGCSETKHTSLTILDCIDQDENRLQQEVELWISGRNVIWRPGDRIEMSIPMQSREGSISIHANAEGHTMISPESFHVKRKEGLDLVLMFSRDEGIDDMVYDYEDDFLDEYYVTEEFYVTEEPAIQDSGLSFSVEPENLMLTVRDQGNAQIHISSSGNVRRLEHNPGTFRWTAERQGYEPRQGTVSVAGGETRNVNITLDRIIPMGSLRIDVNPRNADIRVRHRATGESRTLSAEGRYDLEAGSYEYEATASGYQSYSGNFTLDEGAIAVVARDLRSTSLISLIERIENVSNLQDALRVEQSLPGPGQGMSTDVSVRYYSALNNLATFLFENGERRRGINLFNKIVQEDDTNFQARIRLGEYYTLEGDFEEGRRVVRPLYGNMKYVVPPGDRDLIEFTARFIVALSFYEQFRDESDPSRKRDTGIRAIAELEDVISRYEAARIQHSAQLSDYFDKAKEYRDILQAELLTGF